MRALVVVLAVASSALSTINSARACDPETGERRQMVFLEAASEVVEYWEVASGVMKVVVLPSGDRVGVAVTPAESEKYVSAWRSGRFTPELVKIEIYEMAGREPVMKEMSWGGANSVQTFGRNSPSDKPGIFGHGGFTLNLLKPVCATPGSFTEASSGANS